LFSFIGYMEWELGRRNIWWIFGKWFTR